MADTKALARQRSVLPWGLLLLALAGCGSPLAGLRGKVTFDGEPVKAGTIVFTPIDPEVGPQTGGQIVDGHYAVPAAKGAKPNAEYKVEITALRKSGKLVPNIFDPKGPPMELDVPFIPARYNTETTLRANTSGGKGQFDFDLQGDGPKK